MNRKTTLSYAILLTSQVVAAAQLCGQEIIVHAGDVIAKRSRHLTGACIEDVNHEIYGGLYSQMIFGESFQEPAPPPAVAGFTAFGGGWVVEDGAIHMQARDGSKLVSQARAFRDGAVGVDLKFTDRKSGNAGLVVRLDQPAAGADRFFGYEVALDTERQQLRLARHRNNFELIRDVPCEVAIGRWIALEVRLSGSIVEVFVDAKSVLRYDDGGRRVPGQAPSVCEAGSARRSIGISG